MSEKSTNHLRQRTWAIFIKPYLMVMDKAVAPTPTVKGVSPMGGGEVVLLGGTPWMLYQQTTSFPKIRELIRDIMDELGFSKEDFLVTEIVPTDYIVTPLA